MNSKKDIPIYIFLALAMVYLIGHVVIAVSNDNFPIREYEIIEQVDVVRARAPVIISTQPQVIPIEDHIEIGYCIPYIPEEPCYIYYQASNGCHLAIVWLFFTYHGFTPQSTAAVIGNLQIESFDEINPLAVGDSGRSHGIAQWNNTRLANLRASSPYWRTLEAQLDFMLHELTTGQDVQWWRTANNTGIASFECLRASTCVPSATTALSQAYHRPGRPNLGVSGGTNRARIPRAEQVYERFNSWTS